MKRVEITRSDGVQVRAYFLESARHLTGHGVYEFLDSDGEAVYIGRTSNLRLRVVSHRNAGWDWWPRVAYVAWTPVADYAEAVALEAAAIASSSGTANRSGLVDHSQDRARTELPVSASHRLRALYATSDTKDGSALTDSYMLALHRAGWSLQAIAAPLGITRERVRQRLESAALDLDLSVPSPPPRHRASRGKVWPQVSSADAARMREIHVLATQLRGWHGEGHPFRRASIALTEMIVEARMRGVRQRDIASVLGVSPKAINMRLKSHGYLTTAPTQTKFGTPFHRRGASSTCARGHALAGDNLRLINGDPKRRICRACERIRVAAYQTRKRTAA